MTHTDSTASPATSWPPPAIDAPTPAAAAATAILGGFLIGVVTQVLQGELDGSWNVLANSGVMWSVAAAVVGMLMPTIRAAAAGGAVSMVVASVSYYWAVDWFEGVTSDSRSAAIWSLVGIVAGGAFGLAGWLIRCDPDRRWLALAVVAGLLLGEGRHFVRVVDGLRPAGVALVVAGVLLTIVCARRDRRPLAVLGLVAGGALCYGVAGRVIDAAFMSSF